MEEIYNTSIFFVIGNVRHVARFYSANNDILGFGQHPPTHWVFTPNTNQPIPLPQKKKKKL